VGLSNMSNPKNSGLEVSQGGVGLKIMSEPKHLGLEVSQAHVA
jgi:hypothetical protein